jgi:vitamin B12 transporter
VSAEGGTLGAAHVSAGVSGGTGRWSYAATAATRRTDGISAAPAELGNAERDDHRSTAASLRLEWRGARLETGVAVRGLDASGGIDLGTPTGDDPNMDAETRDGSGRAWIRLGAPGARWRQTVAVALSRIERETVDDPDPAHPADRSRATSEGTRRALQWHHEIAVLGRLTAGAEVEEERATSAFSSDGAFGPFASAFPEERARTVSAFVHHEAARGPLAVGLGARLDDHDRFGAHATFRVTPVVTLAHGTRLKATFGTGFKAPTLFQLFDPDFGNPDLEPETSRGWDAGVEQDLAGGRVRLGATAFGTRFEDLVGFEFPDGYRNVSAARAHGLETFVSLLAGSAARVRASHTWTDTKDASAGSPDEGLALLRRPRHQAAVAVELALTPRADLAVDVRFVGERDDKDFAAFPAARVTLDGYATVRVAGSWALSDGVRLHARIENALDAEYREVFGYGTQGRAFYAGVRAAF